MDHSREQQVQDVLDGVGHERAASTCVLSRRRRIIRGRRQDACAILRIRTFIVLEETTCRKDRPRLV